MSENELTPTPENDPPATPDPDLSASDDTLVLPEHSVVETSAAEEPAEESAPAPVAEVTAQVEESAHIEVLDEPEREPEPEPVTADQTAGEDWLPGGSDIDAALAAVASLSEIMPEREAEAEA